MAENIPNLPGGALPPKKETGKVQPKKETVRINLPPKPTASPTVRLPSPPSAGVAPPSVPAAAPVAVAVSAPTAAAAPSPAQRPQVAVAAVPTRAAAPAAPALSRQAGYYGPSIGVMDKVLAIVVAVLGVALMVHVVILANILAGE